MTHETTAPVQSLADEVLADLDSAEKTHLDGEVRDMARDAILLIRQQQALIAQQGAPVAVPDENGLLPCPFCGGKAELHQRETESLWSHNQVTWSQVGCRECECVGADCCEDDDGSEAVAHWNTRAADHAAPTTPAQQPVRLRFPTMLRKMWSGGEVQAWLDEQVPLYAAPPAQQSQLADTFMLVTPEQLERHALTAWECPPLSRVVLVSSLKRLHDKNTSDLPATPADTTAPAPQRKFSGPGYLEQTGYIPAGSAAEREGNGHE